MAGTRNPLHEITLQSIDGRWETCGRDRLAGITPTVQGADSDEWGSRSLTFTLRRDPGAVWPDIGAFTPVDYHVDGVKVWAGRVRVTPTQEDLNGYEITVSCEGWQYHLDDDVYQRAYVHSDLTKFIDAKGTLTGDLTYLVAAGSVATDGGLTISFPKAGSIPANARAVAILDLGPDTTAQRVIYDYAATPSAPGAQWSLLCRCYDSPAGITSGTTVTFQDVNNPTNGTNAGGTASTPRRYVGFELYNSTGGVLAAEVAVRISRVLVVSSTAYEASNASALKADQVAKDAISRATTLLDADQSLMSAGTFSIPELVLDRYSTPREAWSIANAYQDWKAQIDVDKRPVYTARPTAPTIETVGLFEESSANSGDDIYNRVICEATGPDGAPLITKRTSGSLSTAVFDTPSAAQPANPGFEVNTASWTVAQGTLTRDTGVADSSVASGRATSSPSLDPSINTPISGLTVGKAYMLTLRHRITAASGGQITVSIDSTTPISQSGFVGTVGSFVTYTNVFIATSTSVTVNVGGGGTPSSDIFYLDNVQVFEARPTIPDRRLFVRTKILQVSASTTSGALNQIGDLWLARHINAQLKGTITIRGGGDTRTVMGGRPVNPEEMLLRTAEPIRLARAYDPDWGSSHRDGLIVAVSYDPQRDTAAVAVDNETRQFEALLSRLSIVTGQLRA